MQPAVPVLCSFGVPLPLWTLSLKVFETNNLGPDFGLDRLKEKTRRWAGFLALSLV
jgi:hypothetical protein